MALKSDAQGFLVGELVDMRDELVDAQDATTRELKGINSKLGLIARLLGGGRDVKPQEPSRARSAAATVAAANRSRDANGRFAANSSGAPARSATGNASQQQHLRGNQAAPTAPRTSSPGVTPDEPAVVVVERPARKGAPELPEKKRDRSGRFTAGDRPGKGGEGGDGVSGLGDKVGRLADAVKGMGDGADQIDPTLAAANEVKQVMEPLGRGAMVLFGRNSERQKERKRDRWYTRILKALGGNRNQQQPVVASGRDVKTGSFLGTLFGRVAGGLVARLGAVFAGILPLAGKLLTRIFLPIVAVWGSFKIGQWIGEKIYKWMEESGVLTSVLDAFDWVREEVGSAFDTVTSAVTGMYETVAQKASDVWQGAIDGFVKALDFFKGIPDRIGAVLDAIDQGIRRIPVIGDVYAKAADAARAAAADMKKGYQEARNPVVIDTPAGKVVQPPGEASSVAQRIGRAAGSTARAANDAANWALGKTSERFESGGRGAGTISTGAGDHGGASYGTYQLASKTGTLDSFLKSSSYGEQFKGLQAGSREFNAKWQQIARTDSTFGDKQHAFIEATHFNPQMERLKSAGMDLSGRGSAVKDAVWSTSVQFGGKSSLIEKALKGKNVGAMTDADIVNAIQDYKVGNNDKLFASSSAGTRAGAAKRAEAERGALLGLASSGAVASNQPTTVAVASQPVPGQSSAPGMPAAATMVRPQTAPVQVASASVPLRNYGPVPLAAPVKLPDAPQVPATDTVAAGSDKERPLTAVVREPIGQDVGDRAIAHIVTGGLAQAA